MDGVLSEREELGVLNFIGREVDRLHVNNQNTSKGSCFYYKHALYYCCCSTFAHFNYVEILEIMMLSVPSTLISYFSYSVYPFYESLSVSF